ncbi:isopenicillin N synthase family oxygenase [Neiella marina]|uniref:Isopenicillin N synthase family oxygenase n=1 Tax=Neiella holothuriorum TaxID=2870530 RepID=A0ABS7EBS2_9GAMM|nr:2-oxoglutarate and iron-dependent oxygenase domain-containing protein [Neiella holothuriorum]MBW8189771.1 isopenicillin N synthase family oxygenase [Neiella holothuriorum]
MTTSPHNLQELQLESTLGALGEENQQRAIPVIDLTDFDNRKSVITEQLWLAATECGFFQLSNHGIALNRIEQAFTDAESFFALPSADKQQLPLRPGTNAGWESMAQVRPSTGTADQKESYQITRPRMTGLWPQQALPAFESDMLEFEASCWQLGMKVLSCFADKLGFASNFFAQAHQPDQPSYQSTLRLLHYYATNGPVAVDESHWRAGAHTDFDCLTLLFQQSGQHGLQVCPGKEASSQQWTPVEPQTGLVTCNIGDMLMRWSDDQLKSTLHRVRMPTPKEYQGARYSIAFFCQANKDVMIQGPLGKYPAISADDYLQQRIQANFANKK